MSKFFSKRLSALEPYNPGPQPTDKEIKLNTNENPYPPSPQVMPAVLGEIESLQLYPDSQASELTMALAKHYGLKKQQVFTANGSDEVMAFCFMAFCDQDTPAQYPDISYGFFKVYSQLFGVPSLEIPLKEDFSIDVDNYLNNNATIFLPNPNAPTGLSLTLEKIETILKHNPDHLVFIDEAYSEFSGQSCVSLLAKYDNLLISSTLSKSRSLAGARCGYALTSESIIEDLNKIKYSFNPYNVSSMTQAASIAALQDQEYFTTCNQKVIESREQAKKSLKEIGFDMTDSQANFLFIKHPHINGKKLYQQLKQKGFLVRHFQQDRIEDYLRITIGTPAQMTKLLAGIREILSEY